MMLTVRMFAVKEIIICAGNACWLALIERTILSLLISVSRLLAFLSDTHTSVLLTEFCIGHVTCSRMFYWLYVSVANLMLMSRLLCVSDRDVFVSYWTCCKCDVIYLNVRRFSFIFNTNYFHLVFYLLHGFYLFYNLIIYG